jgi:O-antigen/teichoic acid export membrane protein
MKKINWRQAKSFYGQSVIRNASLLLVSNISMAGLGFLFWIVVAHTYTRSAIGVASVVLTAMSLITTIGLVGLDSGIVRFLSSSKQREKQYQSTLVVVASTTALISIAYVVIAPTLSSKLEFIHRHYLISLLIVLCSVVLSLNAVIQSSFISERRATFVLQGNLIFSSAKIGIVSLVATFGAMGIIFANATALCFSVLFGSTVLARKFKLRFVPKYSSHALSHVRRYAGTLVLSGIENGLVVAIIPLLVLNRFGSDKAAIYYIVLSVSSVMSSVASSTFQSLLAEGSHDPQRLSENIRRSATHVMILLIPIGLVLIFFGHLILSVFGAKYAEGGTTLLRYFAFAAPLSALNYLADGIANVLQRNRLFLGMNTMNSGLILVLSILELNHGLNGLGTAWLLAQLLTLLIYVIAIRHEIAKLIVSSKLRERRQLKTQSESFRGSDG